MFEAYSSDITKAAKKNEIKFYTRKLFRTGLANIERTPKMKKARIEFFSGRLSAWLLKSVTTESS